MSSPAGRASAASSYADMVPRKLLDDATAGVERLKQKLDEANAHNQKDMEEALNSMHWQLRTLQNQCRTAEDQLKRSLERERELRTQLADHDVSTVIGNLRAESDELRADNDFLREQVEILVQNAQKLEPEHESIRLKHDNALSSLSYEKERLASEATEALSALRSELEMRTQAYEDQVEREQARVHQLEAQVADFEASLAEARNLVSTADEAANAYSKHNALLEKDVASHGRQVAEQEADMKMLRERINELQRDLQAAEKAHLAGREQNTQLAEEVAAKDEVNRLLEKSLHAAEESGKHERDILSMQIEDQKRRISGLVLEVQQAENDASTTRDQLRDELKRSEEENARARDSLRVEREKLEFTQVEHQKALDEMREQHHGAERAKTKREEELQRRIRALESDLQHTIATTIPEDRLTEVEEEALRGKQELLDMLHHSQDEVRRLNDSSHVEMQRLEVKVKDLELMMNEKDDRVQALAKELKSTEDDLVREQRHRQHAQEQFRALAGDLNSSVVRAEGIKPTKMAVASLEIFDRGLASCRKIVIQKLSKEHMIGHDQPSHVARATAVGIVLSGTRVEETVPGSPAQACGLVSKADELLMVNGQKVSEQTALAALRGDDAPASVVSLLLRKSGSGETVKVDLPRMPVALVQKRQEMHKSLELLQEKAMDAVTKGLLADVGEVLGRITDEARALDRLNFDMQLLLSQQLSGLLEGIESIVARGKTCLLDVDATHQQVHVLQQLTESELRQQSIQEHVGSSHEMMLHKQAQELEGDLKALQEELSASQMLRRECLEDVHELQKREEELESELRERRISQDRLNGSLSRLRDDFWEAKQEIHQHPCAIRVVMDIDYEDTVANSETKEIMDLQLQEDLSIALKIHKAQVEVLCYTRGLGTMAEVKISPSMTAPRYSNRDDAALPSPARELAQQLQRQIADDKSDIHFGPAGKRIKEIEIHGPIEAQTARALRSALLESDAVLTRTQADLARVQDKLSEAGQKHRAAMKEEELMKQEIVKDCDERLRAASADFQEQLARALERGKDLSLKEQAASTQRQASEHEAAMDRHRLESRKKIAELETRNQDLEREMKSIRENVFSLEASLSGAKAETDLVTERLRHVENKAAHVLLVCRRVDEVLLPELSSCLITLNNIESEMAFVHAHTVRAFALNSPGQKPSSQALKDVHRSKDCVDKDLRVLRLQLEVLSQFSYSEPEALLQDLSSAIAFGEGSPRKANGTSSPEEQHRYVGSEWSAESALSPSPDR